MKTTVGAMLAFTLVLGAVLMFPAFVSAEEGGNNFQLTNKTSFPLKFFVDGVYKCTAQAKEQHPANYCLARVPVGTPITGTVQWPDGKTRTEQGYILPPNKYGDWTITD